MVYSYNHAETRLYRHVMILSMHHNLRITTRFGGSIRTTVNIPSDALELAREHAREHDLTLGEAIGELVRKGADDHNEPSDFWKGVKFLPKRPGEPKVTSELVYKLLEESH
jgi:hypothetical protein